MTREENIKSLLVYILGAITEYAYCSCTAEDYYYRKPNTGMLDSLLQYTQTNWFRHEDITKDDCLMIGDASGKEGQFSDIDKKTAENFGIDYLDVDDFVELINK